MRASGVAVRACMKEIERQTNERVSPISPSIGYGEEGKRQGKEKKKKCDACDYEGLRVRGYPALHLLGLAPLQPAQRLSDKPPWPS